MTPVLLDTHVLIWILSAERPLSRTASARIEKPGTEIFVSHLSIWEIVLKHGRGNLWADADIGSVIREIRNYAGWTILPIRIEHFGSLAKLPAHKNHKDPFDRMLVAQALHEGFDIVTADPYFARYGVKVVW